MQQVSSNFRSFALSNFFCFLLVYSQNATNLERFQLSISKREMYPENNRIVDNLVQDLTELPILHVGEYKFKYFYESFSKKSFSRIPLNKLGGSVSRL